MLETIWDILTYSHGAEVSLAILPIVGSILGGIGKGIGKLISGKDEQRRRAAAMRWSPWTGMGPEEKQGGSVIGDALAGAGAGAKLGAGYTGDDKDDALSKIAQAAKKGGAQNPWTSMAAQATPYQRPTGTTF